MTRALSPIHRPLDDEEPPESSEPSPVRSRIALLAALDHRAISGHRHSLGPGGASAMFTQAVQRALVEEMAFQLRHGNVGQPGTEIGEWAFEIIAAFCEE